jgi:hypothetical protein
METELKANSLSERSTGSRSAHLRAVFRRDDGGDRMISPSAALDLRETKGLFSHPISSHIRIHSGSIRTISVTPADSKVRV